MYDVVFVRAFDIGQRGATFGKAARFKSRSTNQPMTVMGEIDALLNSLGPLRPKSVPAPSKYHPNVATVFPKAPALSFAITPRDKKCIKTPVGPVTYDVSKADKIVRRRVPGHAWRAPPPKPSLEIGAPPLPRAPSTASSDHASDTSSNESSDTESDASSVDKFIAQALDLTARSPLPLASPRRHRQPKSVGYYVVSFSLVEPRVRGTPLIEQAERCRASLATRRRKGRLAQLLRQGSTSASGWLVPQLPAVWTRRRGLVPGFGGKKSPKQIKPHAANSQWHAAQLHEPWATRGLVRRWSTTLGRDRVQCRAKDARKIKPFGARLEPQSSSLGPGRYDVPRTPRTAASTLVPFKKVLGRAEAAHPFGRKHATNEHELCDLVVDRKWVEPRVPAARMLEPTWTPPIEDTTLELTPAFDFGKKRVVGGVPFAKAPARWMDRTRLVDPPPIDVRHDAVAPRVKGIVGYQPPILEDVVEDVRLYLEPQWDLYKWPTAGRTILMAKEPPRWPAQEPKDQLLLHMHDERGDTIEVPTAAMLRRFHRPPVAVNMSKANAERFGPSVALVDAYIDAEYDTTTAHTRPSKTGVNMAKSKLERPAIGKATDHEVLQLDVDAAVRVNSKAKRVVTSVNMDKQTRRPSLARPVEGHVLELEPTKRATTTSGVAMTKQRGRDVSTKTRHEEKLQLSPQNPTAVLSGFKRTPVHVDMGHARGRDDLQKTSPERELHLSPKTAAVGKPRTKMHVDMGKGSARKPILRHTSRSQHEELQLSPKATTSMLSKYQRTQTHVDMGKASGR
ncbi:Aste57867_20408 [Aphanomyces stellatus]|uniref:Aste57867_20408 protein n=1 Tax=Aphanomyces stellatus TaxID=120398 RepID=A0A485LFL9_9STRA|nr:hypothetical protein As57867_020342 [Aphanomyces stellatus]VFT97094.1 Aste57867_20408 [Aphanomyces stellatus]